MFGLLDACDIVSYSRLPQYLEALEDAVIGEVEAAVAVATVLPDGFVEGTLFCDVSLFVAPIADVVATSASKEGTLNRTSASWGQGHPILGCHAHWCVSHVGVSDLLQRLYLLHFAFAPHPSPCRQ